MIAFLGLSPAWQTVYDLRGREPSGDSVFRTDAVHRFASGKATNAAAEAARHADGPVALATVVGGGTGKLYEADLFRHPLRLVLARSAETRACTTVVTDDDATELIEEARPESPAAAEELLRGVRRLAPRVVCGCGSLPPGVPEDTYAKLCGLAEVSVLDAAGPPLLAACGAGATLVKPNAAEVRRTLGIDDVAAGAKWLLEAGAKWAFVTDGGLPALLVGPDHCERIDPPPAEVLSAVGAGDAACGRIAAELARGLDVPAAVRLGLESAAARCGELTSV